ncbi:Dynamin, GTPase domain protein [Akanthomyces lecanii RCEF 1005]|uniref:Dynamin, GTPase domain protein n=1 Tax=Akanthomyces lecanii RCEF 1005 TaxID=1081108 RepID=A0A168KSV8_CORDF|nr:Dynamin, GTPase domain protein [Akanthomyces lecanii RCEF 1005]
MSQETCADELRVLSSFVADSDDRSAWPFIRRIKVSLNAHILSKGLVLVDLPGLRDLNAARRNITERYLRECDDIFAVCGIGRVTTDQSVQDVLRMPRHRSDTNIGVVCTKSDDVVNDEALHDWQGERGQRVRSMQSGIETDDQELQDLKEEYDEYIDDLDYLTSEETTRFHKIVSKRRQVKERLETKKFR